MFKPQLTVLISFTLALMGGLLSLSTAFAHPIINPEQSNLTPLNRPAMQATGLITVSPISLTVTEPNGTAQVIVTLSSAPTSSVTIGLTASSSQCTLSTNSLILTNLNWNVGATLIITAANDQTIDGDQPCNIQTAAATSLDNAYKNAPVSDITVTVKDDGQGPILQLSPMTMTFRLQKGVTPDPFAQQYASVTNGGTGTLNWNASLPDVPWLQVIRQFGGVADLAVGLKSSAANLAAGNYTGTVTIDAGTALHSPMKLTILLEIFELAAPTFQITPTQFSFSGTSGATNPPNQTLSIKNGGAGNLTWTATEAISWLILSNMNGTAPSDPTLSVEMTALASGTYTGTITLTSAEANNSPQQIPVTLVVTPATVVSKLSVSPTSLTFQGQISASNPAPQLLIISNIGQGTLTWNITETIPWLTVNATNGAAPATPQVSVDLTGLTVGLYTGTLTISAAGAQDSPQTVMVTLVVAEAASEGLRLLPNQLEFAAIEGKGNPLPQTVTISNTFGDAIAWIASESIPWLTLDSKVGETPATIKATVDSTALTAGTYNGLITVTAPDAPNSPQTVIVTLVVAPFVPQPELHLTKLVSARQLSKPEILLYTMLITNSGEAAAVGVDLVDSLSTEMLYITASNDSRFDPATQTVTWSNLTIAAGETLSYTLQVSPTVSAPTTLTNTAVISLEGLIKGQSQAMTVINFNQNSVQIMPNLEAILPIPNTPHLVRFPATVTTEAQEISAATLDKPTQETTIGQVTNPDPTQTAPVVSVDKSGLAFQLTAQGASTITFIATPAEVEITPYLQGTGNDDVLFSFRHSDTLVAGAGNDVIYGGEGNDILQGEAGSDKLYGEGGNDTLFGGNEIDFLYGGAGNDVIYGSEGNDLLFGEGGNDLLFGRQGNDTLLGGDGADIFGLVLGEDADIIVTFIDGQDKLGLPSGINFNDLLITVDGSNTRIAFGAETLATLQGVASNLITSSDFTANINPPTTRAELSPQQTTLTDWFLYYWDAEQDTWRNATTTCDTPSDYTRSESKISVPICRPGEFTWLRITANPPTGPIQSVYVPLIIK